MIKKNPRQAFWPIKFSWATYNRFSLGKSLVHGNQVRGRYYKTRMMSFGKLRVTVGPNDFQKNTWG